jgi:hypothetical protein
MRRGSWLACAIVLGSSAQVWGSSMSSLASSAGQKFSLKADGLYTLKDAAWTFEGRLPSAISNPLTCTGQDRIGAYQELSFKFTDPQGPMSGRVRLYDAKALILFSQTAQSPLPKAPQAFPDFSSFPQDLHPFSFEQREMAPPVFHLEGGSNVWLLFDSQARALVLSPASHFMTASMLGDGRSRLACGFNPALADLPSGFSQDNLLALAPGINAAWELWGQAMTDLQGKERPANDADKILKYFGYWTDAGAAYWYNYEMDKGYEGTLKAVASSYKEQGIPLGYMQLDSWWYHKTLLNPAGQLQEAKNGKLPEGDWNRYGGTVEYRAHPFIFPKGMKDFSDAIGLPVINHNRWIDPSSPYHQRYAISGLAAVDPGFWEEIAGYLQDNGSIAYEQDWLNEIFKNSPELASRAGMDDAFLGSMAAAFKKCNMSLQYCMGLPMHFLQGSKYSNLTSIRPSFDRFAPGLYRNFLFTSRLATALGEWPWCDVFMSAETNNMLLAALSAGPVGCGDFLGKESKDTVLRAVRADGVILKPEHSLLPTDASYLAEASASGRPLVATAFSTHQAGRTTYAVAYKAISSQADTLEVPAAELGLEGETYAFDYFAGKGQLLRSGQSLLMPFHGTDLTYFILAPLHGGIAIVGDTGKFVSAASQRIASMKSEGGHLELEVLFAPGENSVILRGFAKKQPKASLASGEALQLDYDAASHLFFIDLRSGQAGPAGSLKLILS